MTDAALSPSAVPSRIVRGQGKAAPRILVLETSSLISLLNQFTDPYHHSIEVLERLTQPPPGKADAPVQKLYIPDQVFYEFSGILPISIPKMVEWFVREADNPKGLNEAIEFYVTVSPRTGDGVKNQDMNRDQLRTLLRYIAKYPDCLGYDPAQKKWVTQTNTARHYMGRIKAEHSVLGAVGVTLPENYRPTIGNVMDAMGSEFDIDRLRIHAGQLFMMGFYTEDEYNKRMEREGSTDEKPRFIKILDFGKHLHESKKWITDKMRDKIRLKRDELVQHATRETRRELRAAGATDAEIARAIDEVDKNENYLTVGFMKHFSHLLGHYRDDGNQKLALKNKGNIADFGHGEQLVHRSVRPARMLVEHYFYGGILPMEARADVAEFLGFVQADPLRFPDPRSQTKYLDDQGFFERALSAEELKKLDALLSKRVAEGAPYQEAALQKLHRLVAHLPVAVLKGQDEFDKACQNPSANQTLTREQIDLPNAGVPYEKVFSEELINGTIHFAQFYEIAKRSGSLVKVGRSDPPLLGTHNQDIVVSYDPRDEGKHSTIWIRQSGQKDSDKTRHMGSFVSRSGLTHLRKHYGGAGDHLPLNDALYWRFSAEELIERARQNRGYSGDKDRLDRAFATMLYRGVSHSASQLRTIATQVLDEDTFIQMEKDFTTRHARGWTKHLPPFTNPMAALHVARRIARKNMGEIATAEMATLLADQNPDAKVLVVNHDSDLFPDEQGVIHFSEDIKRMHSGRRNDVDAIEQKLIQGSTQGTIEFLRTDQLMDTVCLLLQRQKPPVADLMKRREPYPGMRIKESMSYHVNSDWKLRVHDPIAQLRSSQPRAR